MPAAALILTLRAEKGIGLIYLGDYNNCHFQDYSGAFLRYYIQVLQLVFLFSPVFISEDDVLQWLAGQVDASRNFNICITRDDLVQRGFLQWQRQKKGSPANKLHVTFIGEPGIDTGALSKEFLTGIVI